jgi:hypothetical protein
MPRLVCGARRHRTHPRFEGHSKDAWPTRSPPGAYSRTKRRTEAEKDGKPESAKFWLAELSAAEKRDANWIKPAGRVVERYRDERDNGAANRNVLLDGAAKIERATYTVWTASRTLLPTGG